MNEPNDYEILPIKNLSRAEAIKVFVKKAENFIGIVVESPAQYSSAIDSYKETKLLLDEVKKTTAELRKPWNEKADAVSSFYNPIRDALQKIADHVNTQIIAYESEQRLKQEEEQRKLNEKAEKERQEAYNKACRAREEEEKLRMQAEQANNKEERSKLEKLAQKKAQIAHREDCKSETIVAPIVQAAIPEIKGSSTRTTPAFECTNNLQFVEWCIAEKKLELLTFNQSACVAQAKVFGSEKTVPGGRFFFTSKKVTRE
jgi:nucleosome binding factor SPN SPT16 subunit